MRRPLLDLCATSVAVLVTVALLLTDAKGEGINFFTEFDYLYSDSETTEKSTGRLSESRSSRFDQLYNLNISKTVYPYLSIRGGGIFGVDDAKTTSDGVDVRREERTTQPFLGIDLNNPLYNASLTYLETEIKEKATNLPEERNFRDEFIGALSWRPVELPIVNFSYTWINSFDSPETTDQIAKTLRADTLYEGLGGFTFQYSYTNEEIDERKRDFETLFQSHDGRIIYSRLLSGGKLGAVLGYRIRYNTNEFSGTGSGTVPLIRAAGLFSIDDTPADGPALQSLPSIIDGNLSASTGINIGLNGDRTTLTNMGLDFGFPTEMDTLFLWVDRSFPAAVSDSFSWEIYVSPDNTDASTWTLHATVFPAPFGTFQNRFEISFPPVTTRFIKVVTRPLSPAVIGSAGFQDIFVTELEGFITVSGETDRITQTEQTNTCDLRWRPRDDTTFGYNFFYRLRETDPSTERDSLLTNSISANHIFNKVFRGSLRLLREDRKEEGEDREAYTFNAALRGDYLETFRQTLTYRSDYTSTEGSKDRENSLFLRNRADLYKGWSAFLDTGYNWNRFPEGRRENSLFMRVGTDMIPNEVITLNLIYSVNLLERTHEGVESSATNQLFDVDLLIVPLRTLSLFAGLTFIDEFGSSRSFQSYSANWSPFPDGTLQFFFNYIEELRSAEDLETRERSINPGLRWDVTRNAFLETSYTISELDTLLEKRDTESVRVNLLIRL